MTAMASLNRASTERALALRGLTWADLMRSPFRFSRPTMRALKNGQPVSAGTLKRFSAGLHATPVLPELAGLAST